MELISTRQFHSPSTEYCKRPFLIDKDESAKWILISQDIPDFVPFSIDDLIIQSKEESSISLRPAKDIESLESFYTFNNPIEVKRFLLTHDYLIHTLFEAHKHVREIFGDGVDVYLEVHRDQEEDFEGLFIIVKTNLSPDQSLDLLDRFDEEWWLDVDDDIRKILGVDVENIS